MLLPSREITIEITNHCGADCIVCTRSMHKFGLRHMSSALFKHALDEALHLGAISLDTCGYGDIFMDPGLEEKLVYAKTKYPFLKIFVSTTCHLVNKKNIHLLKYVDTLKVSMYGMDKEAYESVHRGALKFEKIMENLERIVSLPKGARPYLIALFLVVPENKHQLEQWKKFWLPRADEIMVWLPHNYGGTINGAKSHPGKKKTCGRPFKGNPFIHADGKVSVCCFDYNKNLIIGDITKQALRQVLEGEELKRIRRVHSGASFDAGGYICKKCDQTQDRQGALLYSSNTARKAGIITSHPDLINDMGSLDQRRMIQ